MFGESLRYSRHALEGMKDDGFFEDDVESTIDWPTRRARSPKTIEHFGYVFDGRLIQVVTDLSELFVITVIDVEKRTRDRQQRGRKNRKNR
jgi:hypothetical protein